MSAFEPCLSPAYLCLNLDTMANLRMLQEFMDSFYEKRLATKESRIQEMRKAHALLERQVIVWHRGHALGPLSTMLKLFQHFP